MLCDNKCVVAVVKNFVFHCKTKHIKIKYHVIREAEKKKEVEIRHDNSDEQETDIFTKSLQKPRFEFLISVLGFDDSHSIKKEC